MEEIVRQVGYLPESHCLRCKDQVVVLFRETAAVYCGLHLKD